MTDKDKIVSLSEARGKDKEKTKSSSDDEQVVDSNFVYCSFCGRPNSQVMKMIQGPGVNICSECTIIAVQYLILEDRIPSAEAKAILSAFWRGGK